MTTEIFIGGHFHCTDYGPTSFFGDWFLDGNEVSFVSLRDVNALIEYRAAQIAADVTVSLDALRLSIDRRLDEIDYEMHVAIVPAGRWPKQHVQRYINKTRRQIVDAFGRIDEKRTEFQRLRAKTAR